MEQFFFAGGDAFGGVACVAGPILEAPVSAPGRGLRALEAHSVDRWHLGRIVMLAAETGARFERDKIRHDPAAWMAAPRRLFGGVSAIEACREETPFLRAMLFHTLSCGLDAHPDDIDELLEVAEATDGGNLQGLGEVADAEPGGGLELHTAIVVDRRHGYTTAIFYAAMAEDVGGLACQLVERVGPGLVRRADIRRGFDRDHPVVRQNVSLASCDLLVEIENAPSSPLADGLNLLIEHRFKT